MAVTEDGNRLIYSDSPLGVIGMVDITDPTMPKPLGNIAMDGEPTTAVVAGDMAFVGVNTSESFTDPSGSLRTVDLTTQEVVASCDLAVASEEAQFCTPGVHIGLFCSTPMVALSRNLSNKHAMEMLLTGDMVPASRAAEMGLVNQVVPSPELRAASRAMAKEIAEKSSLTVATGKRAFYEQKEMDLARSIQEVTEEIVLKMASHVRNVTGQKYLCLAGGVALNCVANGKLLRSGIFEDIFIQPAAGDAGGALGCAYIAWYQYLNNKRLADGKSDFMNGAYLGPEFSNSEIQDYLDKKGYRYKKLKDKELPEKIADLIANQKVIGWFQGRMEFGPRALGGRTIIGDSRSSETQKTINLKIKYRESFRPFAPSIREENICEYFDIDRPSPYMLLVADVKKDKQLKMTEEQEGYFGLKKLNIVRSEIPAVTHVDYSARIQSVNKKTNPRYHEMLTKFNDKHGCPVVVNTSFNVRGEPIVCTPKDAYLCFMRTKMDYLILNNFLLKKANQKPLEDNTDWMSEFDLD